MSEVYHIREMSTEKAFRMMSDELASASELWKHIKTEADRMNIRRRQLMSTNEWACVDKIEEPEFIKPHLDAMTKSGNLIDEKIDNMMEKIMFVIHIGGTCKNLNDDLRGMVFADMTYMVQKLQSAKKKVHFNLDLVENCYNHLKDYLNHEGSGK